VWWRLDGWGPRRPRRKEGEWGEGPSLAITAMFCSEFANVFWLSVSMRKVAGEHPFCVLIYMNSYIFRNYFILFIYLSYLILDFVCLTLSLADTHGIAKYARTYIRRHKKMLGIEGVAEWRHFRRSLHEPQAHGTWLTTADTAQVSTLSLLAYAQPLLGKCMLSCTPKCAPHLPNTTMPTKSCTHPHLGSIAITLTLPSAFSPELLHNCRGINCAHARFIMLMTLSCYFPICPSCSACYSSKHCLTMYMCFYLRV